MADLAGTTIENGINMNCYEMFSSKDICGTDQCSMKKILNTGKRFVRQDIRQGINGKSIQCLNVSSPYRDNSGNIIGIIEDFRDITDLIKAEEKLNIERGE